MAEILGFSRLDMSFNELQGVMNEKCSSLLKKHLTRPVFENLKHRETNSGAVLLDVIRSGICNLDSSIGVYAPDTESYTVFADLLDRIIEDYHHHSLLQNVQPVRDFGNPGLFTNIDPAKQFIISTRIRCARTLKGYPMHPKMSRLQYGEMEKNICSVLSELQGDLAGDYLSLVNMDDDIQRQLVDEHLLYRKGDQCLQAANAYRFWPVGRGIFLNASKTFLVWINEEDHLRIISISPGSDLKVVYGRFVRGVQAIEAKLPCMRDKRLGYTTFCPTNLGTTIRASVLVKLSALAAKPELLQELANRYCLQIRGTNGEHSKNVDGVFDISNKRRLGITEYQAVREMEIGVTRLIEIERSLSTAVSKGVVEHEGL